MQNSIALTPETRATAAPTWTVEVSPVVVDSAIAVIGAVVFAVAGVLLGFYMMPPFGG